MNRLNEALDRMTPPSVEWRENAYERLRQQARPAGSLGVLEEVGARLAGIARTLDVRLTRKVIVTCAGDHGVCAEGVSLFPAEVTPQMVYNFVKGGASINVLAHHAGAEVKVADLGVNWDFEPDLPIFHKKIRKGTDNLARGPAMTRDAAVQSIEAGIEIVEMTRWDPRALGVRATPIDVGVTHDSVVWLHYGNYREGTRIVWLELEGKVLDATRIPDRSGRIIASTDDSLIYYCGVAMSHEHAAPLCSALAPGHDEPIWQVSLGTGDWVIGGALAPGRMYVAASLEGGQASTLFALGEQPGPAVP